MKRKGIDISFSKEEDISFSKEEDFSIKDEKPFEMSLLGNLSSDSLPDLTMPTMQREINYKFYKNLLCLIHSFQFLSVFGHKYIPVLRKTSKKEAESVKHKANDTDPP